MPTVFRDAIIQPIPKETKDPSLSFNYCGIVLASSLSKIFEWSILLTWNCYFYTNELQFVFKPASSTTLCTGVIKAVVNHYFNKGSKVYACLIDASKAFDTVSHYGWVEPLSILKSLLTCIRVEFESLTICSISLRVC